jgi:pimeloyl-ACP methyl ester carboxylesterase
VPRFETAPKCPFNLPAGQTLNQTALCGYVIVPETHAQPNNGKTLKIAVLVFKTRAANPAEPVIYLEGGPGGHIQSIIDLMTGDFYNGFTARGDAIFFDQRGVGNSQPELYCPEIETQSEQDAPVILSPTDDAQHSVASALACHDRLVKQGVNLAAFNSVESAGDVNDIRLALGYAKINVYGASYGTILAQTVMRLYPQIVRSIVIDSVVPPDVNPDITAIASGSRTMNLIFQTCAADTACNRAYPNLKDLFTKTYNMLNTTQPTVKVTIPETNKTLNVKVDGSKFVSVLFQLLYDKQTIQLLPRIISLVNSGNTAILAPLMAVPFEVNLETDLGMYFSVECAEEWPFSKLSDNQAAESQALPEFAQDSDIGVQSSITLCQKWNVPAASQAQVTLLKSDIPTLVMEGQFDPITPPDFGQKVAQGLSKSFYVEFPYNGHGEVVPDNVCGINVMKAFLDNPAAKPDSSCTSDLTIKFS